MNRIRYRTECNRLHILCECGTSNKDGGSIYASSLSSLVITHTSFEGTLSDTDSETQLARSGGALFLRGILSVTIHEDTFTRCYISADGGAIFIKSCFSEYIISPVIHNCIFMSCKGTSSAGGGMCVEKNQYDNFVTNSLFSKCANAFAGALWLNYQSMDYSSGNYPVKYCFFNKNYLMDSNGSGTDTVILLKNEYSPRDDEQIFLHCYSTSESKRVAYLSSGYHSIDVIWLPLS